MKVYEESLNDMMGLLSNALHAGYLCFFMPYLSSADISQNQIFRKLLSGIPLECKTV